MLCSELPTYTCNSQLGNLTSKCIQCSTGLVDYIGITTSLVFTFTGSEDVQCTDIIIIDDTIVEDVESFTATLVANPGVMLREPSVADIRILPDGDSKYHD